MLCTKLDWRHDTDVISYSFAVCKASEIIWIICNQGVNHSEMAFIFLLHDF